MESAGAPPEKIASMRAAAEAVEDFEVWPDNWRATLLFRGLSTQWQAAPMGGLIGLNYAGVEAAMRIWQIPRRKWRALFSDVQIMEAAAVGYFNEKRELET